MIITEIQLQECVAEELAFDPEVTSDDISVSAKEGIVTLRGTVPSFNQRWEAEKAAGRVRGVTGIVDELVVELPGTHKRNDADIAQDIQHRFASNPAVPADVKFIVRHGFVTLTGDVEWYFQAREAADDARRVYGVLGLANKVTIHRKPVNGPDIERQIRSAFARVADADAGAIHVTARDGTVTLTGAVRSIFERERAGLTAWRIPGVVRVENLLTVFP